MTDPDQKVKLGITRLLESERDILEGARVGLIANSASIDERKTPTASLLIDSGIKLACLFAPEHGFDASAEAGQKLADTVEPDTGLPVHSLYGEVRQPTPEMLKDIDVFVFDLQDVGVRCYTYIWTMVLAMQSAALSGKLFVVLDRPNPIGGLAVQGPVLEPQFASFLGMYPTPLRYGMTIGEFALMCNQAFGIGADLVVIRMQGWRRRLWFADTGLPWEPPSPAVPSLECALLYAGTCLFEGTNISEGRGTSSPFCLLGAPWLDPDIVSRVDERWLAGFAVSQERFTPAASKYAGTECAGLAISVADREKADPVALTVALLMEIASCHASELKWDEKHFDAVAGTDALRRSICMSSGTGNEAPERIMESWSKPLMEFEKLRSHHLLYEE